LQKIAKNIYFEEEGWKGGRGEEGREVGEERG